MKVLQSYWFQNIGIVKYLDENEETRFRIGTGHGFDRQMDERKIMDWGDRFDPTDEFFKT